MTFTADKLKTFGSYAIPSIVRHYLEVLNPSMFSYLRAIIRT